MKILVLNGGSSSLKATLRDLDAGALHGEPSRPLWSAHAEWGRHPGEADLRVESDMVAERKVPMHSAADILRPVLDSAIHSETGPRQIDAVGHRVVHGGQSMRQTARVTAKVKAEIHKYAEFAPEHNRLELDAMEAAEQLLGPATPQVAVFDTAFHATMPQAASVYPGPFAWYENGIRRYGFHGISHQYVSRRAAEMLAPRTVALRLITCHLGNGASLAAVRGGSSIDTTMGFTPLDGLMMGTRPGSLDPGILIYLVRHAGMDAAQLDRLLNHDSGLKGVSGISGDMREIEEAAGKGSARAQLAFDVYVHRLCREIGGMAASLGGLDALVFTAGVGENSAPLRARVCDQLAFLGIDIDKQKNVHPALDCDVAAAGSRVRILVVRTDEDWEIARECWRILN
jgi:acetate kinase